ncbi:hypothetical protein DICPUDRAFT_83431 [Dictyostelium purpureum]|uniref:Uncharacterized protein n=1 Tax=Dictyostelium purpureum TaxID=5786 RepID=F0ZZI7_DICPU|nr:uncharacterized protein DICPUDRAFT_83431 [Dictyostelium purpureum]EGC30645.1 hypothetical protein DICPUDRAFT_83431 [Dictyostelium purpureum]|eukprot:XP_003292826.1 hypothetical protein DICPUDRAFT_83431 [Dictyostelium purpureum]
MHELDLDYDQEVNNFKNKILNFEQYLKQCSKLKKLSIRDRPNIHQIGFHITEYIQFQDAINSAIPGLLHLTKVHLNGFLIKRNDFFVALSQVPGIKSLKLQNVNLRFKIIYNELLTYLTGNKKLKKLSIRNHLPIECSEPFLKYLSQTTELSYLNIAFNQMDIQKILSEILENHKYQFRQIVIGDNLILPFNFLLSTDITKCINIKYIYGNQRNSIILNKENVFEIMTNFYKVEDHLINLYEY